MNPHILVVIDNQLNPNKYTKVQLKQNAVDAANAAITAAGAYAAYYDDDVYEQIQQLADSLRSILVTNNIGEQQ